MNLSDLENELGALRPSEPASDLERRIANDLSARAPMVQTAGLIPPRKETRLRQFFSGLGWASIGAAAAFAITILPEDSPRSIPDRSASLVQIAAEEEVQDQFQQDEATQQLLSAEEGSLVYEEESGPARVVLYSSLERHVWSNPATGARVEVEVPRQDLVLVPVTFQ